LIKFIGLIGAAPLARRLAAGVGSRVALPRIAPGRLGQTRLGKQIRSAATERRRVPGRAALTTTKIGGQDVSRLSFWRADAAQTTCLHLDRHAHAQPGHWGDLGGFQSDPGRVVDAAALLAVLANSAEHDRAD